MTWRILRDRADRRGQRSPIGPKNLEFENSGYVTVDGAGANPNGPGVTTNGAGTINKNSNGAIDV